MLLSLKGALALAGLFAVGLTVPVQAAANLVKDGDFESANPGQATGSLVGFNTANPFDTNWVIGGTVGIDNTDAFVLDGTQSLFLNGSSGSTVDSITQNLATVNGQQYTLSFAADADFAPALLDVTFGNTVVNSGTIIVPNNGFAGPPPTFMLYSFDVIAAGPFTGLTFSSPASNTGGTLELDDIVVTPAPVPEASTTVSFGLLMALGLGGFVLKARKRVKA